MNRKNSYDLLRIFACIGVISIHVCAMFTGDITSQEIFSDENTGGLFLRCLFWTIGKFGVPCFVMISGAMVISNDSNSDFSSFYKKSFVKLGKPALIVSLLYFMYTQLLSIFQYIQGNNVSVLLDPIKNWLKGCPYYQLWFIYMYVGVYLIAPIIVRLRMELKEKTFTRIGVLFFILSVICNQTSTHYFAWDLSLSFTFLGYFVLGYIIYNKIKKNNFIGIASIIIGMSILVIKSYDIYELALKGNGDNDLVSPTKAPYQIMIVFSAVLLFVGFSMVDTNVKYHKISKYTYYIYLIHAGAWRILSKLWMHFAGGNKSDSRIMIPISIILVFFISLFISMFMESLFRKKSVSRRKEC